MLSIVKESDWWEIYNLNFVFPFHSQTYVKAVNSGQEKITDLLYSADSQKQLVSSGPRVVHHSTTLHKTIDTEDTDLQCLAQSDGKLVTEKKKTFEHEEIHEEDLPESEDDGKLPLGGTIAHKVKLIVD